MERRTVEKGVAKRELAIQWLKMKQDFKGLFGSAILAVAVPRSSEMERS